MTPRVIDAHQHYWRTEAAGAAVAHPRTRPSGATSSQPTFGTELEAAGVDATVLMQSVDEAAENDRWRGIRRDPRVAGVVGGSRFATPRGQAVLTELDGHAGLPANQARWCALPRRSATR